MKHSVIFRKKENRYMSYFSFLGKRYWQYGKTKKEAEDKIKQRKKEVLSQHSDISIDNKNLLNTWFDYWLENIRKPQVKESTYNQTLILYNRHIVNSIGKENIKSISAIKLQKFINKITSKDARRKIYNILENLFDMLQKMNLIKSNPMAVVINPRKEDETIIDVEKEIKFLSYENEKILLNLIKNSKSYHAVKFILYTGLRRGECLGLQWKHIDFDKMLISVKQQFNRETNKITTTKTKAAIRTIPILPEALEILKELGNNKHDLEDFIFPDVKRMTNHLVYFSNKCGFKITPHILRHTFASRCYFTGLDPKIIQSFLGHETIDTTLNTYTHVLDSKDKPIIEKIKQFFISKNLIEK